MVIVILGCIGPLGFLALLFVLALGRRDSWNEVGRQIHVRGNSKGRCIGGAWIGSESASWPLVEIQFVTDGVLIRGRTRWIPLRPTMLDAKAVTAMSVRWTAFGFRRVEIYSPGSAMRVCMWLSAADFEKCLDFAWMMALTDQSV